VDKVKKLIEAGAAIPTAIKESLGMQVGAFCEAYGLQTGAVSDAINGSRRATPSIVNALVAHLGGTPDEWRMLLWEAGRPDVESPEVEPVAEAEAI
jgi:plasmid maintenance system antidote protein VapI